VIAAAFLDAGARRFAMITGDPRATTSQDRVRGFVTRLAAAGVAASDIAQESGGATYDGGAAAACALFDRPHTEWPDALFCINDIMALGAMDMLRVRLGVRIPEDVRITGFDDIPQAAHLSYQLTTVAQPVDAMVAEALALLHLDGPVRRIPRAIDRALPGRLVVRATLRPGPG
jgi:DNA-binding LacI/PurR family transcriptional regulator